jgi:hypothetical protein
MRPEGIYVISDSENYKVLSVCKVGGHCRITGIVGACEDGECSRMIKIESVTK